MHVTEAEVGINLLDFTSTCIVPAMMLANQLLDRLATAARQMHDFYICLVSLLLLQWSIPTPFFKFIIF